MLAGQQQGKIRKGDSHEPGDASRIHEGGGWHLRSGFCNLFYGPIKSVQMLCCKKRSDIGPVAVWRMPLLGLYFTYRV